MASLTPDTYTVVVYKIVLETLSSLGSLLHTLKIKGSDKWPQQ